MRLDQLTTPVDPGKFYQVPTVFGTWYGRVKAWPVIGARHNDAQCLNFDHQHYHLDGRFLVECAGRWNFWRDVGVTPLMFDAEGKKGPLPQPVWRRRKCRHTVSPSIVEAAGRAANFRCHFDMWLGEQARHDGRGWVCPHRSVALADHAAINGVITCPLHLLRIDAASGLVLPPLPAADKQVAA